MTVSSVAMDTAVVAETQNIVVAAANADFNISYCSNCSRFSWNFK
jgi:hypothetical protein